jgi:hypothetical protein
METSRLDRVIETIWPPGRPSHVSVWAILDAARDERIYPALQASRLEYLCLYSGKLPEVLRRAAPYLIELAPGYSFTRPLLEMGWGHSWGVFVKVADARNLRHHLRGFLRVQDEAGRRLVFRYYDPRVLRAYLPTCTTAELAEVYVPIGSYFMEGERGESVIEFAFDGRQLAERRTSLVTETGAANRGTFGAADFG